MFIINPTVCCHSLPLPLKIEKTKKLKMSYKRTAEENSLVPRSLLMSNSVTLQVKSILGEGAFAKVYKCVKVRDTKPFAIKVLRKTRRCHKATKAEVCSNYFFTGPLRNDHVI